MCKILCSTGALIGRPNNRDFTLLRGLKDKLRCDSFEFMMYSTWYDQVDELTGFLKSLEIPIPVMHCEKHIGEIISLGAGTIDALQNFEINCRLARSICAQKVVLHLWDGITSDTNFENNLAVFPELEQIANDYGVDLLIENVVCNYKDPMLRMLQLKEKYPDVHFVFDTKMAAFHNQLDLLYSDEYSHLHQNIRHYHINDYGGGYMDWTNLRTLPIGKGNINFVRFFEFIKKIGYCDTFTVESTAFNKQGSIDTDMLNNQFEAIRRFLT